MYTVEGIVSVSAMRPFTRKLIPWDSARRVTLGGGERVLRCTLLLREEHFPIYVPGNGVGGFRKRIDVGRTLIADLHEDRRWIDVLVNNPAPFTNQEGSRS